MSFLKGFMGGGGKKKPPENYRPPAPMGNQIRQDPVNNPTIIGGRSRQNSAAGGPGDATAPARLSLTCSTSNKLEWPHLLVLAHLDVVPTAAQ